MIYISYSKNIKKILIENSINNESDINRLYKEINSENTQTLFEITFIEIKSVPTSIVKKLYQIKNRATITTTKRTLWLYLRRLGIKNSYINTFNKIPPSLREPIKAIAIGGSAGSLNKVISIVESIPYLDVSIFIIMHILPDKKNNLLQVLQNKTDYKVYEAKHNIKYEPNCIYIAPPDHHLIILDEYIYLDHSKEINYTRPSVDVSFKSLAYEYQDSLLALLLCGYGKDGSSSLKELKQNNSEIIIEDPSECEAKDMPLNAIKTKNYTKVLNTEQIKSYIRSSLLVSVDIKSEIENFLENIYIIYGYDFRNYNRNSLSRRIETIMQISGIDNYKKFEQAVFNDEKLLERLLRAFSINVSNFFRNPKTFKAIRKEVLPHIESLPSIRIWCAGCSHGEEAYSIAIMLDEAGLLNKSQIYATDFNATVLDEAQNGLFAKDGFEDFKSNYIESGGKEKFEKWFNIEDDFIEVNKNIKDRVVFFKHNLVSDSSINEFHIIFCRNVLIYFDEKLKKRVLDVIDDSISPNGFLILGESETLYDEYHYKIVRDKKTKIYKKGLL